MSSCDINCDCEKFESSMSISKLMELILFTSLSYEKQLHTVFNFFHGTCNVILELSLGASLLCEFSAVSVNVSVYKKYYRTLICSEINSARTLCYMYITHVYLARRTPTLTVDDLPQRTIRFNMDRYLRNAAFR